MDTEPIKITGLAEFNRNLRKINNDLPKGLRLVFNEAGKIIVSWAVPEIPKDSGAAAGSVKAKSTRTSGRVSGGSAKVPYFAWLNFGGAVGRNNSVRREYVKEGRYLYPGYVSNEDKIQDLLERQLVDLVRDAGIEVD
jgi:hypothetical protein